MASTTWSADLRHPVYATRVLCEVANERGVPTAEILAGTGIDPADLDDPEAVVTAWDEIVAVRRLLARLPDDAGVGVDVGNRFTLTHAGLLGFAAMACANLREMFTIDMRYDHAAHRPQALRGRRRLRARTQCRSPTRRRAAILHRARPRRHRRDGR